MGDGSWVQLHGSSGQFELKYATIYQWTQRYLQEGKEGLQRKRGRKPKQVVDPSLLTETQGLQLELEALKKLNYRLDLENRVLKKNRKSNGETAQSGKTWHSLRAHEKWLTDVTEFAISKDTRKLFLSPILDLYGKSILAYNLSFRNNTNWCFKCSRRHETSSRMRSHCFMMTGAFNTPIALLRKCWMMPA